MSDDSKPAEVAAKPVVEGPVEKPAAKPAPVEAPKVEAVEEKPADTGLSDAQKAWIRHEIDLAMQGHGPEERRYTLNP